MKLLYSILASFVFLSGLAQDHLTYFSEDMRPTDASDYYYKRLISATDTSGIYSVQLYDRHGNKTLEGFSTMPEFPKYQGLVYTYFPSGKTKKEERYTDGHLVGIATEWYENQQKKSVVEHAFSIGIPRVKILEFWKPSGEPTVVNGNGYFFDENEYNIEEGNVKNGVYDGTIKGRSKTSSFGYEDTYANGKFVKGKTIDPNGSVSEYDVLEQQPEFEGGISAFYKYVGSSFRLPQKYEAYGRILVSFVVEKDGSISEIKVVKGLEKVLDDEAIRLVSASKKWNPGKQRGRLVRCAYSLPIVIPKP